MTSQAKNEPPALTQVLLVESATDGRLDGRLEAMDTRGVPDPLDGPRPVEEALQWAREVAEVVIVQSGALRFSAGRKPAGNLENWADATLRPGRHWYEPPGPRHDAYVVRAKADGTPFAESTLGSLGQVPGIAAVAVRDRETIDVTVRTSDPAVGDESADNFVMGALDRIETGRVGSPPVTFEQGADGRWESSDGVEAPPSIAYHVLGPARRHGP